MAEPRRNPTLEEIRQRCLEIQQGWSLHTEIRRRAFKTLPDPCVSGLRVYIVDVSREGTIFLRPGVRGG